MRSTRRGALEVSLNGHPAIRKQYGSVCSFKVAVGDPADDTFYDRNSDPRSPDE